MISLRLQQWPKWNVWQRQHLFSCYRFGCFFKIHNFLQINPSNMPNDFTLNPAWPVQKWKEKPPWNATDILAKKNIYFTKIIWSIYSLPVGRDLSMLPGIFYLRHPICLYLQVGVRGGNLIKLSRCSFFFFFLIKMLLLSSLCLHTCFHLQINHHILSILTRKFSCYLFFQTRSLVQTKSSKIHWLWFSCWIFLVNIRSKL